MLIAIDGSPGSERALALAGGLLPGKRAAVTLLHVLPYRWYFGIAGPMPTEYGEMDAQRVAAKESLNAAAQRLQAAGVGPAITKCIKSGEPGDLILATAAAGQADLILLGSRGTDAAEHRPLGAVARAVSTRASCAVLVAYPHGHGLYRARPVSLEGPLHKGTRHERRGLVGVARAGNRHERSSDTVAATIR